MAPTKRRPTRAVSLDPETFESYGFDPIEDVDDLDDLDLDPFSYDPREFDRPFNLIAELRARSGLGVAPRPPLDDDEQDHDSSNGKGKKEVRQVQLEMRNFPSVLQTPLDAIRSRTWPEPDKRPPDSTVTTLALGHGLGALYKHPVIIVARQIREQFYRRDFNDLVVQELVADWLRVSRVEVSVSGASRARKVVYVPEPLKREASGLAGDLGISLSSLATLAVALTLVAQSQTHPEVTEEWAEHVATFLHRVGLRARGARLLMRLDRSHWAKKAGKR